MLREKTIYLFECLSFEGFASTSNLYLNKIFHLKTAHNYHYPFVEEKVIMFFIIRILNFYLLATIECLLFVGHWCGYK